MPPRKSTTKGRKRRDWSESEEESSSDSGSGSESDVPISSRKIAKPLKKRTYSSSSDSDDDDAGASSAESVFDDGMDDEMYKGPEDRERLAALPDIEREILLAQRYEQRLEARERWERKHNKKHQAAAAGKGAKASALSKLRADREAKARKERKVEQQAAAPQSPARTEGSQPLVSSQPRPESIPEPAITLEDIESIRLTRNDFEKWADEPFLDDTVPGMFVRVGLGKNLETGEPVYRMAVIEEVIERPTLRYKVGKAVTNKMLLLRIADARRQFKMDILSNGKFEPAEYRRWLSDMRKAREPLPDKHFIEEKLAAKKHAETYVHTPEEIEQKVRRRKEMLNAVFNVETERQTLRLQRDRALEMAADSVELAELNDKLRKMEELANEQFAKAGAKLTVMDRINERNRKANFMGAEVKRNEEGKEEGELDPFSRLPCLPTVLIGSKSAGGATNAAADGTAPAAAAGANTTAAPASSTTAPAASKRPSSPKTKIKMGIDPHKAHNFDFDLDIVI